jgi:hypothetical protein
MKPVLVILFAAFAMPLFLSAQIEMIDRSDLLQERDIHSGIPLAIADMNGDGLDDIVTLDEGYFVMVQYQTPDPNRPFVRYHSGYQIDNFVQNDIVIADFNNDGAHDMLITGTYDEMKFLYAIPNTYEFEFVEQDLQFPFFSQGASPGDFNNDGWVDVVVLNDNGANYTLMNDGTGHLEVSDEPFNWVTEPSSDNSGNYGCLYTDFDVDGDIDFYIAKCRQGVNSQTDPRRINVLHENLGNGIFVENAKKYGLASGRQSWTTDFGDIDNDGDMDAFMTQHDVISELYENIDNDTFINITASAGLEIGGISLQGMFRDFDNDGFQDLLVSGDRLDFFRNNGDNTFSRMSTFGSTIFGAYGLGDLNHDGFTDVYASRVEPFNNPHNQRADILYLNVPNDNNYLSLDVRNGSTNPGAIGAMALLYGEWGTQIREVRGGEQYGLMNSYKMVFGVGESTTYDSLVIRWPDGTREHFDELAFNQHYLLHKGGCFQPTVFLFDPLMAICNNDTIAIEGNIGSDLQFVSWSNGQTESLLRVAEPGLYYAHYVDEFSGCPIQSLPIEVTHNPDTIKPSIAYTGVTSRCFGDSLVLSLPDGLGYTWSNGATTQVLTATTTGTYFAAVEGYCALQYSDTINLVFVQPEIPIGDPDTFLLGEPATLYATGDSIAWYADIAGTELLGTGNTLVLNGLTETTTVYAQNHGESQGADFAVGPVEQDGVTKYNAVFINGGLEFTVEQDLTLNQLTIYTDSVGLREIEISNGAGLLWEKQVDLVAGANIVELDAALPAGEYTITTDTDLNNAEFGNNNPFLWRSSENVAFPYEVPGIISITTSTYGDEFYYYFYDWKVTAKPTVCKSLPEPVIAFFDMGVGISGVNTQTLHLSPNPTTGEIFFTVPTQGALSLAAYSIDGVRLMQEHLNAQADQQVTVDLSAFESGMYTIRVQQAGISYIARVVRL